MVEFSRESLQRRASVNRVDLSLPEIAFVAATRGIGGAGIGLLLADCFKSETRKSVGWTLVAIGAVTTVPIALGLFARHRSARALPAQG
jgi:hypothetical protein